jgi:hypothetical protein
LLQLSKDPIEATRTLLQRFQEYYSDSSYAKRMFDSLQSVNSLEEFNATIGNMTRQAVVHNQLVEGRTYNYTITLTEISFCYTFGETTAPHVFHKAVVFSFTNGKLESFTNGWQLYKIGSEKLVVSKDQAINIAIELLKNSSSTHKELRNNSIIAELNLIPKEPFEVHPFWFVELPLALPPISDPLSDRSWVHTSKWQVGIWGDTGEIVYAHLA